MTRPGFPPPPAPQLGDYDITDLHEFPLPCVRVEYVDARGEVYSRVIHFAADEATNDFAILVKRLAMDLIATHVKSQER